MKSSTSHHQHTKPANAHSCIRCFRRKVKCDKERPCSACIRHSAECVYRLPHQPRPRKERPREDILIGRIEHYEALLRQFGIDPDSISSKPQTIGDTLSGHISKPPTAEPSRLRNTESINGLTRQFTKPRLVHRNGQATFFDNNVWTAAVEEISSAGDTLAETSDEDNGFAETKENNTDFVLGLGSKPQNLNKSHPSTEHILELWHVFVENVNALIKIVHEPTIELEIKKATEHIESVPKNLEALMFSIYSVAAMSMTESDCEEMFNEPRQRLLARYRLNTKVALSRARFLSTGDIMVLQALLLHLISMRDVYGPRTLWTMMGIVGRLAESMGLHCDGTHLGLPPFETEMRRRIWWQLRMFDSKFAELAGNARVKNNNFDPQLTHLPSNVNDNQLYPGMTSFPLQSEGLTDMCFSSLTCELIYFWTTYAGKMRAQHGKDDFAWKSHGSQNDISDKERAIEQLEQIIENKYDRNCDPTRPAQLITLILARTATHNMHFIAHHPRRWNRDEDISDHEREYVWSLAVKQIEAEITVRSNRQFERFAWFTSSFFPWAQAIHVLDRLKSTPLLSDATKVWRLIGEVFEYFPDLISKRKLIYVALGNLCLKAYSARVAALTQQGKAIGKPPCYITKLRSEREAALTGRKNKRDDQSRPNNAIQPRVTKSDHKSSDTVWQPEMALETLMERMPSTSRKNTSSESFETPGWESRTGTEQNHSNYDESLRHFANIGDDTEILSMSANDPVTFDIDSILQDNYLGDVDLQPMDWNQWDTLLRDLNGTSSGF